MSAAAAATAGRALRGGLDAAAGGALLVMAGLTFVDVIGRYGFHRSVFGAAEMIELLMVAVVFGGFACVTAGDGHIRVTLVDHLLRARWPAAMRWLNFAVAVVVYGAVLLVLWRMALDAAGDGRRSIVLGIPYWAPAGLAALLSTGGLALLLARGPADAEDAP